MEARAASEAGLVWVNQVCPAKPAPSWCTSIAATSELVSGAPLALSSSKDPPFDQAALVTGQPTTLGCRSCWFGLVGGCCTRCVYASGRPPRSAHGGWRAVAAGSGAAGSVIVNVPGVHWLGQLAHVAELSHQQLEFSLGQGSLVPNLPGSHALTP